MLKKAGIVVAAATAGLLALSPLAFAGDKGGHDDGKGHHHMTETQESPSAQCTFDATADNSVEQGGTGGESLLGGVAGAVSNVAAPVNGQTQAPVGSCNNVEDVVDLNIEDNVQDNSQDNDEETLTVEDSGNTED